jgi:hypothetical protein
MSHVAYSDDDKLIEDVGPTIPKLCAAARLVAAVYFKILFFLSVSVYCSYKRLLCC